MRLHLPAIAGLLLLCLILAAPTLHWPFANDDYPQLLRVQGYLDSPARALFSGQRDLHFRHYGWDVPHDTTEYYRPVDELFWVANFALFGYSPWGYRLTNGLIHFGVALGIYFLAVVWLKSRTSGLLAAALFSLLHVASAPLYASIDNRSDSLPALFGIWALVCFILYRNGKPLGIVAFLLAFLAVFSKESALLFPVAFILYDTAERKRTSISVVLGSIGIVLACLAVRFVIFGPSKLPLVPPSAVMLSALWLPVRVLVESKWAAFVVAGPLIYFVGRSLWRRDSGLLLLGIAYVVSAPLLGLGWAGGRFLYFAAAFLSLWLAHSILASRWRNALLAWCVLPVLIGAQTFISDARATAHSTHLAESLLVSVSHFRNDQPLHFIVVPSASNGAPVFYNGLCEAIELRLGRQDCRLSAGVIQQGELQIRVQQTGPLTFSATIKSGGRFVLPHLLSYDATGKNILGANGTVRVIDINNIEITAHRPGNFLYFDGRNFSSAIQQAAW